MHIVGIFIIGVFVGLVMYFIKSPEDTMGLFITIFTGAAGAFAGKFIGEALGIYSNNAPAGFIGAILGALFTLVFIKRGLPPKKVF